MRAIVERFAFRAIALGILATPATVSAQIGDHVSVELVGAVNTASTAPKDPFVFIDATATVRVTDTLDVVVRPYVRRLPGGDWSKEMYQLQIRYQPETALPFRVDAGIISSPLGIMALEMRPDRNPVIGTPSYYFTPLPSFDGTYDRVTILSGGYPLGAIASLSGRRWDARAGVTDGTPARNRKMISSSRPPARPQFVTGGGITPFEGLRIGAGFANGVYREPTIATATVPATVEKSATVFNLEGEYSIGYTRIAGEWIRDSFDTTGAPAVARGLLLEATRTLTPRIWVAGRTTRTSTPVLAAGARTRRVGTGAEATVGYRLSNEILLKAGYQGSKGYAAREWTHAAAVSCVLFKRWW
jgi:hypothetical protein